MAVYYNEIEPSAVLWLQAAMDAGIIAKGDIDTRSIEDVTPNDLMGYTQCHFFAGIGGWSIALRLAGWPDDRPVWTGSCPCQSFSKAGKGLGRNDPRHLWPSWFWLIQQCRPPIIFGEQVANAITHGWWDDVATDLESEGYSCGASVIPACSVGAPHKRERLWFMGYFKHNGRFTAAQSGSNGEAVQHNSQRQVDAIQPERASTAEYVAYSNLSSAHWEQPCSDEEGWEGQDMASDRLCSGAGLHWIECPDGKQRPVEPRICLLVDGLPARLRKATLHGFGNAIHPEVAAEFIKATTERLKAECVFYVLSRRS